MGLKHFFKGSRDMTREQEKDMLERNGVVLKQDNDKTMQRKFKFGQFSSYAQQQARGKKELAPRIRRNGADEYSGDSSGTYSGSEPGSSYRQQNRYVSSEGQNAGYGTGNTNGGYRNQGAHSDQYGNQRSGYGHHSNDDNTRPSTANNYSHPYSSQSAGVASYSAPALDAGRAGGSHSSSSGSYSPPTQSSYGTRREGMDGPNSAKYDPYGPESGKGGEPEVASVSGQHSRQQQQQKLQQVQKKKENGQESYDPYAQQESDAQTVETDFNKYPNADSGAQSQTYKPYLEAQKESQEQNDEEYDSEEEEVNRIVRQTKDVRQATVQSSGNILRNLREADDSATNTMGTLGAQREKMYQMERGVNLMDTQQRFLDDHVKELEHYNRGLFHIKASNPFTRNSRKKAAERKFLMERQADRERDSQLNGKLHKSQRAILSEMDGEGPDPDAAHSELRDKEDYEQRVKAASKYLTDDHDEEDERMEVEYSKNIDEAHKMASNLHSKANIIAKEIESQNRGLNEISEKVNKVDDKMAVTTNRIRGI